MKRTILIAGIAGMTVLAVAGCRTSGTYNANSNAANRAGNAVMNTAQSAANTVGNAANSVANAASNMTVESPADFLHETAQGSMAEIEMSKMAAQKAQNAEVKKFAQMMVSDHSKTSEELKTLAAKKNIPLPPDAGSFKNNIDALGKAPAEDFDKTYVDFMVDDHVTDVEAFAKQAESSSDPDVKAFAAKTLPILKKHLDAIKAIQGKL